MFKVRGAKPPVKEMVPDSFYVALYDAFDGRRPLSVLDLGCALGSGFVSRLICDGHFAIGVGDATGPNIYRTDITKPFEVEDEGPIVFDAIVCFHEHVAWGLSEFGHSRRKHQEAPQSRRSAPHHG